MHNKFSVYVKVIIDKRFTAENLQIQSVKIKFKHNIKAVIKNVLR